MNTGLDQPPPRDRRRRNRLLLAALAAGLGVILTYAWVGRRPPPPPPAAAAPSHVMEGLSLNEIQDGVKRWVLKADSARYLQDRQEIHLTGIRLEFYGEPGRVISLSCQEGVVDTRTRGLTLQGEVEVREGELRITTALVRYLPRERLLVAPQEVTMENPRLKVEGRDLSVSLAHRRLVLKEHRLTEVRTAKDWRL